jgi:hypothetical protein
MVHELFFGLICTRFVQSNESLHKFILLIEYNLWRFVWRSPHELNASISNIFPVTKENSI